MGPFAFEWSPQETEPLSDISDANAIVIALAVVAFIVVVTAAAWKVIYRMLAFLAAFEVCYWLHTAVVGIVTEPTSLWGWVQKAAVFFRWIVNRD